MEVFTGGDVLATTLFSNSFLSSRWLQTRIDESANRQAIDSLSNTDDLATLRARPAKNDASNNYSEKRMAGLAVLNWLADQQAYMVAMLEELVNTDSGTADKAGVDRAGHILEAFFREQHLDVQTVRSDIYGDAIIATLSDIAGDHVPRPIILMGHRDTVFGAGESARRPFRIEGDIAFGPGVADMKSGLVMNAFVMAGLKRFGGNSGPVIALITGDEEIASPFSRPIIEDLAGRSRAAFNSEPTISLDHVVQARKGAMFMRLDVFGRGAHAGANPQDGRSAIEELALKIPKLHALTNYAAGTTVNVGVIGGGQTVNTVAPYAFADFELRYFNTRDKEAGMAEIMTIVNSNSVPDVRTQLKVTGEFLPFEDNERNHKLFSHYKAAAQELGNAVEGIRVGGGADSGLTSAAGCPTLCSVGPVGGKGHSVDEFVRIGSIVPRSQALALAIIRLPLDF